MRDGGLQWGRWAIGAGTVLGATLLAGRLSGLLREIELAATFGISVAADAAVLLLTLPDLLVNLLLSGGLSAALVPRLRALPADGAALLLRQAFAGVMLFFGLMGAALMLVPGLWFSLLAPGMASSAWPPTLALLGTALAVPLTAASGVTSAGLNANQRFFVAGCGTLIFNIVVIAALFMARIGHLNSLTALGIGIALGAALRLATQIWSLPAASIMGTIRQSAPDRIFLRGFLAAALAASLLLLVPVIVRALASVVRPGAIAALNYAFKLVELPTGVLVTSLATVAFSRLSEHHGSGDREAARRELHDSLRRAISNAVGAGLVLAYFADAIVDLVLGRGAMNAGATARVAELTRIALVGVPFLALSAMATAELNARQQPQAVLKATLACLLLLPVLALPGVMMNSERLLCAAVVGFQVTHSMWLAGVSGLLVREGRSWLDAKLLLAVVAGAILAMVFAALDQALAIQSSAVRVAFAGIAMVAVVALPQRLMALSRPFADTVR